MSHQHTPEVANVYYCRECGGLMVKVPAIIQDKEGRTAWGFRMVPLGEFLRE